MIFPRSGMAAAALAAAALAWVAVADTAGAPSYVFTTARRYAPEAWLSGRDRFPSGATLTLVAGGKRRPVAPGFSASADAAISFDGARIVFAGKRLPSDKWQIWETAVAGGPPRRVVPADADCIRPLYVPDGRLVYTRVSARNSDVEIVAADGGKPERLTHAPGWFLTSDVLRDGRILLEYAESGRTRELYTVYPDGSGIESLRCDHGADRSGARQMSSGDVVFNSAGRLARFTSALARQVEVAPQPAEEVAGPIAELGAGKWIVALRGKAAGRFGLAVWDSRTRQATALEAAANGNAVQPVVVGARVPPRDFPSALVPTRSTGNLLCLNARDGTTPIAGDVRTVRLFTRGAGDAAIPLGQTAVEPDGSFYVEVPADRPLRMELLDGAGRVLQAEHGWFWMRPSEQRVCVGCHAGPERSPENKVPEVLLRTTVPAKMLGEAGS